LSAAALLAGLTACAPTPAAPTSATGASDPAALALAVPEAGLAEIDSTTLYRHPAELASDAHEGRGTGPRGEEMTVEYIAAQMRAAGLEGGAADGSFFQPVPLRGATVTSMSPLVLTPDDTEPARLEFVSDFIATTDLDAPAAALRDAELVFV